MINIKAFADYKATKIEDGWSKDEKYLLETDHEKLLLKLANINHCDRKSSEFEIYKKLEQANIPSNLPIGFGVCDSGEKVWMALSWVEGWDLRDQLLNFTLSEQYEFGVEAGKILRRIHQLEIPKPSELCIFRAIQLASKNSCEMPSAISAIDVPPFGRTEMVENLFSMVD